MSTLVELKAANELVAAVALKLANRRAKVVFLEGALRDALAAAAACADALDAPSRAALPVVNGEPV